MIYIKGFHSWLFFWVEWRLLQDFSGVSCFCDKSSDAILVKSVEIMTAYQCNWCFIFCHWQFVFVFGGFSTSDYGSVPQFLSYFAKYHMNTDEMNTVNISGRLLRSLYDILFDIPSHDRENWCPLPMKISFSESLNWWK